jgi:hypothetical protein
VPAHILQKDNLSFSWFLLRIAFAIAFATHPFGVLNFLSSTFVRKENTGKLGKSSEERGKRVCRLASLDFALFQGT